MTAKAEAQKKVLIGEQALFDHAREHHGYEGENDYGKVEMYFLEKGWCPKRIGDCFVLKKW